MTLGDNWEISVTRRKVEKDFDFLVTLHNCHAVVKQDTLSSREEVDSLLDKYYRSTDLDSYYSKESFSHSSIRPPSKSFTHNMQSIKTMKRIHVSFKGESFYLLSYDELKSFLDKIEGVFKLNYLEKKIEIIEPVSYTHLTLPTTPYV